MRYVTLVGLTLAILAGGTLLQSQASMYWEFEVPDLETMGESEVVVQDTRPEPPRMDPPTPMYSTYVDPETDSISEEEPVAVAPIRTTEDTVTVTPQSPRQLQRTLREPAQPSASSPESTPRPAVTQPGGQPETRRSLQDTRPADPTSAPGVSQAEDQKPVTKKMKWGQTDSGSTTAPQQAAPAGQ